MGVKSIIAGAFSALMLSESAFGLSCARPDLVKSLEEAKDSPKIYHILVGNFTSLTPGPAFPKMGSRISSVDDQGRISLVDQFKRRSPRIMPSTFEGYSLAQNSYEDAPLSRFPVDIEVSCVGQWCSDVPSPDRRLIAFVEAREGQAPILRISPCPSQTFEASEKYVQKIRQCLDKSCQSAGLGR